jgi:hypothetical protein
MGMHDEEQRRFWLEQIDAVLRDYEQRGIGGAKYSHLPEFESRALALVQRLAPGTAYEEHCRAQLHNRSSFSASVKVDGMMGVVRALRADVEAGYLRKAGELVRGDLFADFLQMAEHLLDEGFKDAAAVIAGSSIEQHLRQMCVKSGLAIEMQVDTGRRPKKADTMNTELSKAGVYHKLDSKSVTAWLDLRNKAAHGRYGEYELGQVRLMLAGVRDFITRYPA